MNDAQFRKLLETSWQRALSPEEESRLRAWFIAHPQRQAEWEEESSLNTLLQQLPAPPAVASNFTSRVMDRLDREERHLAAADSRKGPAPWRRWRPRLAGAFLLAGLALAGVRLLNPPAHPLVEPVKLVGVIADIPNAETLRDFEVIQELPPPELVDKVDMELWAALQ